jgi:hypothetical protein
MKLYFLKRSKVTFRAGTFARAMTFVILAMLSSLMFAGLLAGCGTSVSLGTPVGLNRDSGGSISSTSDHPHEGKKPYCSPKDVVSIEFEQTAPPVRVFSLVPELISVSEVRVDGQSVPFTFDLEHECVILEPKAQGTPGSIIEVVGCHDSFGGKGKESGGTGKK